MKKVLLFGALGALGCMLGWAAGELMLRFALPWANKGVGASIVTHPPAEPPAVRFARSATQAPPPPTIDPPAPNPFLVGTILPQPPLDADLARRLVKAGAHSGDVEVGLKWYNINDLDLHVVDPFDAGEEIYFGNKRGKSGGWLDVDMNANEPYSSEPVEHVFFPGGKAPNGHYKVYVVHYASHAVDPSHYYVEVLANGRRSSFTGTISNGGIPGNDPGIISATTKAWDLVCEFDVQPAPTPRPRIRLSVPPNVSVFQGGTNDFRVAIARGFFSDPVSVQLEERAEGLTIDRGAIPGWDTGACLRVHAATNARPGNHSISVVAVADTLKGHVEDTATLTINVLKPPAPEPAFKISVPQSMQVVQANRNSFKVRVGRYFFTRRLPVTLLVEGAAGLTAKAQQIMATADAGVVEIMAARQAEPGRHRLNVIAKSGSLQSAASIQVEVIALPPQPPAWRMIVIAGGWTALLAVGLWFMLALGQSHYLNRTLLNTPARVLSLLGVGAAIGALAGATGQAVFAFLERANPPGALAPRFLSSLPPALGQVLGWFLLGALLGRGFAFSFPNLSGMPAWGAGGIAGLAGAGALLDLTRWHGPLAGRVAGALVLGVGIGCLVPLSGLLFPANPKKALQGTTCSR